MRAEPVPVAVVGVGNMGRHHARNYDSLAESELRAIVDSDLERAQKLAERYGAEGFATVDELLEQGPEVSALSVATPTHLHHDVSAALLKAGKHVLVEKPIAPTVAEADSLAGLAAASSVVLAVGHVERFNPAVRELKHWIDTGRLGEVLSIVARRVGLMPPQVKDANVVIDLAVHDIDIFQHLLGADTPDELYCNAGKAIAEDRYDFADVFFRYGQVACFLQVNWVTPVKIRSLAVTGTDGYVELEYVTQRLEYYRSPQVRETDSFAQLEAVSEQRPELVEFSHVEPLAQELIEFLKAVRGEPAETVTAEEARRTMEVAARIVELVDAQPRRGS
jgi:UDP-N-acetylglucosamine 3-dehydrogenase